MQSSNRRYYLHSAFEVDYDVQHYRTAATQARASGQSADYLRAAELYRGAFLLNVDSTWAEETRLELHAAHLELLVTAAEGTARSGHYEAATRFYALLTDHEPYSDSAWEALAEMWERRGHPARAAEVRRRFEELMDDL